MSADGLEERAGRRLPRKLPIFQFQNYERYLSNPCHVVREEVLLAAFNIDLRNQQHPLRHHRGELIHRICKNIARLGAGTFLHAKRAATRIGICYRQGLLSLGYSSQHGYDPWTQWSNISHQHCKIACFRFDTNHYGLGKGASEPNGSETDVSSSVEDYRPSPPGQYACVLDQQSFCLRKHVNSVLPSDDTLPEKTVVGDVLAQPDGRPLTGNPIRADDPGGSLQPAFYLKKEPYSTPEAKRIYVIGGAKETADLGCREIISHDGGCINCNKPMT
jgi:hypothetical protein